MLRRPKNFPVRAGLPRHAGLRRRDRGFTLIEMVAVIVLAGLIFSFGGALVGNVFSGYSLRRDATDAGWQARVALERLARGLRAVRSATATDLDIGSAAQVRFVDTDGNGVCFYRDAPANRVMRSVQAPTGVPGAPCSGGQVLADNVTSVTFSYWNDSGIEIAPGGPVAGVYYVTVDLTVVEGSYNGRFRTSVQPRNF
jgi:prepilin-type N-terminal cleavage/methylation domain-containing protein